MPSLSVPRSGHAAATLPPAVVPGRIVVFGGEQLAEGDATIASTEYFDRDTGEWSAAARR